MTMRLRLLCLCACLVGTAHGQTTTNPDISAIGDFRVYGHNDESRSDEVDEFNIADPELELNVGGYLNPYARADAVVAWHGEHNAEIEELFATVERGLPLGAGLRVGKYLLEFGRLNPVHPHAYSFTKRPLPHEVFFGEEGLSDVAIRSSFLIPTGAAYTELMAGVLKGDALSSHEHEHEHAEDETDDGEEEPRRGPGFFGRLTTSLAVAEASELAVGASALNAVREFHKHEDSEPEELRAWLLGGDVKYKYRPDRRTAVQVEAEILVRIAEQPENEDNLTSIGGYVYVDYRFHQKYNLGGIAEWTNSKELHENEDEEHEVHESRVWRAGAFVGWAPIEETSLVRLAGHWTEPKEGDGFWEATLQFVVSLGPHKPHNF